MLVVPIIPVRGSVPVLPSSDGRTVSGLIVNLDLELAGSLSARILQTFRLDTGTACSAMSLAKAERLGLLRDDDVVTEMNVRTAGTTARLTRVRMGRLVARIPAVRSEVFEWPILYHESWPEVHPTLLGLAGVVADLDIRFNGTPHGMSAFGTVTLSLRA